MIAGKEACMPEKEELQRFIRTRLDLIQSLDGPESSFEEYGQDAAKAAAASRREKEIDDYINTAVSAKRPEAIRALLEQCPTQSIEQMLSYKWRADRFDELQSKLGEEKIRLITERHSAPRIVRMSLKLYELLYKPIVPIARRVEKWRLNRENPDNTLRGKYTIWRSYWKYARVPKEKDLWVITSYRHKGYLDNTMYFYEYMVEHHPEVRLYWVTTDSAVLSKLRAENKPVVQMDTPEGTELISRAAVAITDHYATSDYSPRFGFNAGTKVVQLWHGVGFKRMGDGTRVLTAKEPGLRYSYDILPGPKNGALTRVVKRVKYWFRAPFRELFEEYFMLICPGLERIETIGRVWNVPEEAYLMAGNPRDIHSYALKPDSRTPKIMYAPTFRYDEKKEQELVHGVLDHAPDIQALMEELGGEFHIRLHPHTWRSYERLFEQSLIGYDRVHVDLEKDVYTSLGTYSLMVSDYSSISLDMARLDRPVIYYCPDYDWFLANDDGFGVDYVRTIPGVMTRTWEETLEQIRLHMVNPETNADLRRERIAYFFDERANGPDNSERIAQEIKRRLGLEG